MINLTKEPMYEIEVGTNAEITKCHCFGQESFVGHGFVYKDGDAYAVYYVGWSRYHLEKNISIALAIGEWGDNSTSSDRTCFGIEAREGDYEIQFQIINPEDSPWPNTELLGVMLSREESIKHPLLEELFNIVGEIVGNHPAVRNYLNM
jgi:hypothetical protein